MNRDVIKTLVSRYCVWPLASRTTRRHPRVLAYHRFCIQPTDRKLDLASFRRQLAVIRDQFQPVTFGELLSKDPWIRAHAPPLAVITVDDGYADFYEIAWPALREAGVPATVFVTVDFIEGRSWLWPDALEYLLFSASSGTYRVSGPLGDLRLDLTNAAQRRKTWDDVASQLIFENGAREAILTALQAALDVVLPYRPTAPYSAMTWEQLRELSAAGIEIGSHTMSHPFTAGLSPELRRRELRESKRILQEKLQAPVDCFAYPNGQPADAPIYLREEVKAASYRAAVVCHPPREGPPDLFGIGRWTTSDDHAHFLNVMYGASLLRSLLHPRRLLHPRTAGARSSTPAPADG